MALFSGLDSPMDSDTSSSESDAARTLHYVSAVLLELADAAEGALETKLGLSTSALITLDIMNIAQRAKSYRRACVDIADQTYQLLNAVDGGVKGRAIDINGTLRHHIKRLNEDLEHIRQLLKCFAGRWNLSRFLKGPQKLEECYAILAHGMQMYLLLLRCSLAQAPGGRRSAHRKRWSTVPPSTLGRRPAAATKQAQIRDRFLPKANPRLAKSVSQPPRIR